MYSAAYFETSETSLEDASIEKLDRICRKLDLSADDRVDGGDGDDALFGGEKSGHFFWGRGTPYPVAAGDCGLFAAAAKDGPPGIPLPYRGTSLAPG